jgi:hypothetical protein
MVTYRSIPDKRIISTLILVAILSLASGNVSAWQNPYSLNPYSYMSPYRNYGSWYPPGMSGSPWSRGGYGTFYSQPSPNWKMYGGMNEWGDYWFVMQYRGNVYTGGNSNWYYPGGSNW